MPEPWHRVELSLTELAGTVKAVGERAAENRQTLQSIESRLNALTEKQGRHSEQAKNMANEYAEQAKALEVLKRLVYIGVGISLAVNALPWVVKMLNTGANP